MRLKAYLLLWLFCLAAFFAAAQESLFFRQINTNNGLSDNVVNCIMEDGRGFIWIGTEDGLNRFDGASFTVFRHLPGQPGTIGGNNITCITEDEQGNLWIATKDGGLSRYNYRAPASEQFINFQHNETDTTTLPTNSINYIWYQQPGTLWVATGGKGLVKFDTRTGISRQLTVKRSSTFNIIARRSNSELWAGSVGGGIIYINTTTQNAYFDDRYINPYKQLPHVVVTALFADSHNNMWTGSWDKTVYRFAPGSRNAQPVMAGNDALLKNDDALCFTEDDRGRIWTGTQNSGLLVYDPVSRSVWRYQFNPALEGALAGNTVYCLLKDRGGNIWAGTNRGISLYRPALEQFGQEFLPPAAQVNQVFGFYEEENGRLLIGTDKGLFTQQPGTGFNRLALQYNLQPVQATSFYKYGNNLLLGTNYTLFRLNTATGRLLPLPDAADDVVMKKIIESRVVSMAADTMNGHPVLWTVPYGHYITWYDFTEGRWVSRQDSTRNIIAGMKLRDNLVSKIWVDDEGTRWMATVKYGLGRMRRNETTFTWFSKSSNSKAGLPAVRVFDIMSGGEDTLWISTYGNGLFRLNRRLMQFTHIPGSPNLCEGLQRDSRGNIWFIAKARLWRYDAVKKEITSWQVPDLEKSGGIKGYLYKDNGGRFYAAGKNYFIRFNPIMVFRPAFNPKVYLTNILVNSVAQPHYLFRNRNRFSYSQNNITFQFAAPRPPDETGLTFEYRLSGGGWSPVVNNNTVSFPSLPPGRYSFEVRVTGNGQSSAPAVFNFRIIPPFYQTWWFYSICALLVAAGIYFFYRYRINELVKRQAIRNKIARDLHDNIGSTLGSISVYGRVGVIHNEKGNSKELQEILERISSTSSEMINEMNDIVWAINPGNDSMEKIVDRMQTFATPLLAANQINFTLEAEPALLKLNLDMEKRNNLYLVFKECLHNAVKYSGCTQVTAKLYAAGGKVHLEFADNGRGFDPETNQKTAKLGGAGLPGMRQRVAEMKGRLDIQTAPGAGVLIHLQFPA